MTELENPEAFAAALSTHTAKGIALETSALIRSGRLPVGSKLPTVRDVAYFLGVSPATVSEAWRELRVQKMISGRGRKGSWVCGDSVTPRPSRMSSVGHFHPEALDLSLAVPDVELLPDLEAALAHGASAAGLNSYERIPILGELREAVEPRWPYAAESFLAANGGYNAVHAALHALVMPGAAVAVEDPTALRLLDIVEDLGAEIVPVACDDEGPLPDSLRRSLERRPSVFLFQPRTHSVTGLTVSRSRMQALAAVLESSDTIILEDDGVGDASPRPAASLGTFLSERVLHVVSYSKSLGPDLRLAVLSGPEEMIGQIQSFRSFSSGWTSRILQSATAWLLRDGKTQARLEEARNAYAERRDKLTRELAGHGISLPQSDGLCVWVPVHSEQFALVTLAARHIAVLPGAKYTVSSGSHIRVATSILKSHYDEVADAIALAAAPYASSDEGNAV